MDLHTGNQSVCENFWRNWNFGFYSKLSSKIASFASSEMCIGSLMSSFKVCLQKTKTFVKRQRQKLTENIATAT